MNAMAPLRDTAAAAAGGEAWTELVGRSLASLLGEVGMVAAGAGCREHADMIFNAVAGLRPESEIPAVGRAVARMNGGALEEAVSILRNEALRQNPDSEAALSMLTVALRASGRASEATQVARRLKAAGRRPRALELARAVGG